MSKKLLITSWSMTSSDMRSCYSRTLQMKKHGLNYKPAKFHTDRITWKRKKFEPNLCVRKEALYALKILKKSSKNEPKISEIELRTLPLKTLIWPSKNRLVLHGTPYGEKINLANKLFLKVTDYSTTIIIFTKMTVFLTLRILSWFENLVKAYSND